MPDGAPDHPLIYAPAKREKIGLVIGLSGPSWSGKTFSALRLARGMAGPNGRVALLDTENGRSLTYADDFSFDRGELREPFTPDRYANAAAVSKRAGHDVLIIDSMSHEHAGPGGVLEMHEAELTRLTKGSTDHAYRESMKMVAWIRPKVAHKSMVQRLLQLNSHLILCFRAEEKTEIQLLPNKTGKLVNTPVPIGFQPVTAKDMAYELTILLGFDPKQPGVPLAIKLADKFQPFIPLDQRLDEATGARLAAWARGEKPPAPAASAPRAATPDDLLPPEEAQEAAVLAGAQALIARFEAVTVRADHLAIVDLKTNRDRVTWLKKHRPALHEPLDVAMKASWTRTEPVAEPVAEPATEPATEPAA